MSGKPKKKETRVTAGTTGDDILDDALQADEELYQYKHDQHGVQAVKDSRLDIEKFIQFGETLTDDGVEWISDLEHSKGMKDWNERMQHVQDSIERNKEQRGKDAEARKRELSELLRGKAALAAKRRAMYYEHLLKDASDVPWSPLAPLQPQGILMTMDYPKAHP